VATVTFEAVTKRFSDDTVAVDDLTLTVNEGEFLILVGPSGCGKTTALRMVAGLEEITSGEIRIGERIINDLPPANRDVAMVFQNYALYPHMSVYNNIAFPLRQKHVKKDEIRRRVQEVARLLSIDELLERKPKALSGGQRQRVAIGRALVRRPQAFLMDEPLSNLDAKLRVQMRAELITLHQQLRTTTIYVTHDQTEAMTLGDRVVVLNKGVVQQVDTPERLYRYPQNLFVGTFIGSPAMNLIQGALDGQTLHLGRNQISLSAPLNRKLTRRHGEVVIGFRPEDLTLDADETEDALEAEIVISEQLGPELLVYVHVDGVTVTSAQRSNGENLQPGELGQTLIARVANDVTALPGSRVKLAVKTERIQLFDPDSGESLLATAT
jgi:multiple sugar transport system ATP-binding protein